MKSWNRDRSSDALQVNGKRSIRILAAACSLIAALLLVLTMAIHPVAFAENGSANSSPARNTLVPGQIGENGSATVLVYLNGSDLESEAGEATSDIAEMIESGIGGNANVVIETVGTSKWQDYGIASDHTQRYIVKQGELELVDDSLGQLDTTDPDTLADFISWGTSNYPADRYMLLFWDHGAGPVYGFGYDEFQSEESALTLDEMKQALEANSDVHFDIIGMDCCIMGSLETCVALQPYCDYMVVSEDFEPGIGWSYKGWMSMLEQNPGVDTIELGKVIVDDMIGDVAKDEENGEATLALVDESAVGSLYDAWLAFAYANEDELLGTNYSQETEWRDRPSAVTTGTARPHGHHGAEDELMGFEEEDDFDWESLWEDWELDGSYVTMTDYFVTDIMQVASEIESDESAALKTAFDNAMVHYGSTSGEEGMSGLGVTLPYGDAEFYDQLEKVFKSCNINDEYVEWLEAFVDAQVVSNGDSGCGCGGDLDADSMDGFEQGYDYGYEAVHGDAGAYGFEDMYGMDDENEQGFWSGQNSGGSSEREIYQEFGYDYGYAPSGHWHQHFA